MPNITERKYPLYVCISLLFMVIYKVIPNNYTPELYYYFIGLLTALSASLILVFFKFNPSIHMLGIGSLLMYVINLSIHFKINITILISAFLVFTGLIASSRLYFKTHTNPELIIGLCVGVLSQFLTVKFWL